MTTFVIREVTSGHIIGDEVAAFEFDTRGKLRLITSSTNKTTTVGGLKLYPGGHFHIDTGPRRTW